MAGFEPTVSRPPDVHFSRTKLHPDVFNIRNNKKIILLFSVQIYVK
jgi:hypothetical protein